MNSHGLQGEEEAEDGQVPDSPLQIMASDDEIGRDFESHEASSVSKLQNTIVYIIYLQCWSMSSDSESN